MIRAGEGCCRPPSFGAVSGSQCIRVQHRVRPSACQRAAFKGVCRGGFAGSSTRHMRHGRPLGLMAQQKFLVASCDGKGTRPGLKPGFSWGPDSVKLSTRAREKERMTCNRQARQHAPGAWRPSPRPLRRLQTLANGQRPPPPRDALAIGPLWGSRVPAFAGGTHMTEQGPGRWDEREFPDAPPLLSPKITHRKTTPRSPTSCLSRF